MRRWLLAGLAAIALSGTLQSVARAQPQPSVLRVVPSADLTELDPTRGANLVSRIYSQMVFDTLFALDSQLRPKPLMLESSQASADGLQWTLTLRPGLRFHNRQPVTTRDVVASLQRWMGSTSIGGQLKARLASLEAVDDRQIFLRLKEPFGLVEYILAGPGAPIAAIMPEADATRPIGSPLPNPVGSGPFRYLPQERVIGHRAVFERNPDYQPRSEPPDGLAGARIVKVDRVEWIVMPDAVTAANALVTGEADIWEQVTPDLASFLTQRRVTVRRLSSLPSVTFVRPNFQLPPFNDIRARQALALLFDQREILDAVAGDKVPSQPCWSFTVCGGPLSTEIGSEPYRQPDLTRARALMQEAGYRGEKLILVATPQLPVIGQMAQVAEQRLRQIGVDVDVEMMDFAAMFPRIQAQNKPIGQGGYHLFTYYGAGAYWFHPLTNLSIDVSCPAAPWAGFPCDPDGERLRQVFFAAPDEAARTSAYAAFHRRMWEFLPYIPTGQFDVTSAFRRGVQGILDAAFIAYWNIEKR
ncbi:ABC transporter substrate-binding protein [Belnapia sp. T18]|uniref:ABC transporter substrate-binding protein n=1 Tax=Belnapia arida TaxID=2804533 RepID=A0ABS1UBJ9_9PROT|nr:ABC transporter substrate-binding protein [Belnapia arida]MBL6082067.1 ABC transporter substrate-binding protein [Belnapia arida]